MIHVFGLENLQMRNQIILDLKRLKRIGSQNYSVMMTLFTVTPELCLVAVVASQSAQIKAAGVAVKKILQEATNAQHLHVDIVNASKGKKKVQRRI